MRILNKILGDEIHQSFLKECKIMQFIKHATPFSSVNHCKFLALISHFPDSPPTKGFIVSQLDFFYFPNLNIEVTKAIVPALFKTYYNLHLRM